MIYKKCNKCVMDTTDPVISFNNQGICNHCQKFDTYIDTEWFPNKTGNKKLESIIKDIKINGKGNKYDCIIGLSGGIDSSYLAIKIKEFGLKPLVVHVDAGWNSELAVNNIEKIIKYCNYDLHTHVVNWKDMRSLHLSYLKSGIANQDVPQDHIFFSSLYHFAIKNKIKYIISGGNLATEGVFPPTWHGSAMDSINLKAIHKKFGNTPLKSYKTISFFQYYFWYPIILGMRTLRPLNYMDYNKENALKELKKIGYKPYPKKHGESIFTKFFQNYYLPKKFGFDKRLPHYSSLIVSKQLSREKAIELLKEPLYDKTELQNDIDYIIKKLQIDREEFEYIMNCDKSFYEDYPNWLKLQSFIKKIQNTYSKIFKKKLKVYS